MVKIKTTPPITKSVPQSQPLNELAIATKDRPRLAGRQIAKETLKGKMLYGSS